MADLSSKVFHDTLLAWESPANIIVNEGGTRSGKTYSVLQLLALIAWRSPEPLLISVVTQTFPQLRQGAMRDFEKVVAELPITYTENKSTHTWEIGRGKVEFFSADQWEKVLGAQRDILFVNEANRLGYEVVRQLMVRTSGKKFFDYNPVSSFWMNEEILTRSDAVKIHSTYKDNKHLSASQIAEIESHRKDENWWRVYGLGLEGRLEGLVFPDWELVDEMPEGCRVRYGLDFGFNDPTALVKVGILGEDLYLDEQLYQRGLITAEIGAKMANLGIKRRADKIIGDSAAAEQVETLYRDGWNIHPSKKGAGSIVAGIDLMKRYHIKVTKRSVNLQNELLNYTWEKDKNDKLLNQPIDAFCHCFVGETLVLTDNGERRIDTLQVGDFVQTSNGLRKVEKFFNNGRKKICVARLIFSKFVVELRATPEHRIKTTKGWTQLQNLKAGEVLFVNTSCLTEENTQLTSKGISIVQHSRQHHSQEMLGVSSSETSRVVSYGLQIGTQETSRPKICGRAKEADLPIKKRNGSRNGRLSTARTISCTKARGIFQEEASGCIELCGSSITDQSPKGITSTTKTVTPGTTTSKTLNLSKQGNTSRNTSESTSKRKVIGKRQEQEWQRRQKPQRSGIILKLEESGIANTPSSKYARRKSSFANVVAKHLQQSTTDEIDSAQTLAGLNGVGRPERTTLPKSALFAEKSFVPTSIEAAPIAAECVLQRLDIVAVEDREVFDIQVVDMHEFFANGVLVHNCVDASRYALQDLTTNTGGYSLGFA